MWECGGHLEFMGFKVLFWFSYIFLFFSFSLFLVCGLVFNRGLIYLHL